MSTLFRVGPVSTAELVAVVRLFLDAFHDSARQVYGDPPKPDAMLDVWGFARDVEPGSFLVARDDTGVLGYALLTSSLRQLQRRAFLGGRMIVWALRALGGRYGIRWASVGRLLWNKMLFVRGAGRFRSDGDAQLLNIAVAPAARGRGVATALMRAGLLYLAGRGVREVRLEVRPDNAAAIAVYRSVGFIEKGRTHDIHGEWLVMTARL